MEELVFLSARFKHELKVKDGPMSNPDITYVRSILIAFLSSMWGHGG
jgi:hypothetical protein